MVVDHAECLVTNGSAHSSAQENPSNKETLSATAAAFKAAYAAHC
jgi:hypothetical protein